MGYKDENKKHRQPFGIKPKYSCPNCKNGLNIPKPIAIVICYKCKKIIDKSEIVINERINI